MKQRQTPDRRSALAQRVFLLAPWSGILALVCAAFGALSQVVSVDHDLSPWSLVATIAALVLGAYAALGAVRGRGRSDVALGALLLAILSLMLWVWINSSDQLKTPT